MAINFPTNPNNGDVHAGFTYNSTKSVWESVAPSMMPTSDTPPTSPLDGQMWFDTDGGGAFVYYEDTDSAQWVEIIGSAGADGAAGATGPAGADGSAAVYATVDDLPGTASAGDQAFVTASNRLYLWNGSGWYNIALINTTPSISGAASSYALALDGTPTVVTITATDPEGIPITYSIASDTSGNIATVTSNNNVFTITPSTNTANAGTFSLTFRASDGVNIASAISEFTLAFQVQNSNYTTALITSVGTNNQVNNTFVDSSANSHTITAYGNATQTTFSPYRHGGYSTYFDGSGDYLTGPSIVLSNTVPFTIELWYYNTSTGTVEEGIIVQRNGSSEPWNGWRIFNNVGSADTLSFYNGTSYLTIATNLPRNQWHHIAVVSQGSGTNQGQCYLNGVASGSAFTVDSLINFNGNLAIGTDNAITSRSMTGYLADVRVVNGTAVYTSNFTPPTERLTAITNTSLLTCHLPYISDGSTNGHSITVNGNTKTQPFSPYDYETYSAADNLGSIYFDQSGDYLRADTALDASTSAGDPMTVETWFNVPSSATLGSAGSFSAIWGFNAASGGSNVATFGLTDTGFYWHRNTSGITLSNSWGRDQWHHLAVVYHDGTNGTAVYLNGKSIYTNATAHTTAFADCVCGIGAEFDAGGGGTPGNYFPGHLADFRITHSAVYTSNFTPPTTPLTEITNTALLLKGTNAGIIDKSQSVKTLTLSGDTKSTTAQTKYLSSSMNFNTGSDYISIPSDAFAFGTSDFTIEFWIYHTSTSGFQTPLSSGYTSAGSFTLQTHQNTITYRVYHAGTLQLSETASPSANTWYHIAVVRDGGTMTLYRDGTATATGNFSNNYTWSGTAHIGAAPGSTGGPYAISGYMSDLRITKGLARYTANFTPPTAALEG